MSKPLIWLLGLAGLALLTFGCVATHGTDIESDLYDGTSAALARAGFPDVSADLSGRDVTLVGTVPAEADRARALASAGAVRGVRLVRDGLTVGAPAAVAEAPAFAGLFSLTDDPGGIVVRGRVPHEAARASVLARIGTAYPGRPVTDQMTTDPAAADWQGAFMALLPVLGDVAGADATIDNGVVLLRGRVATAEEKARVEAAVAGALPPGVTLRSEITVAPSAAPDSADAARGQLTASGDASLAGAEAALGEALAVGRVEFDSGTARLTARSHEVLDRAAAVFARFPAVAADVKGYTDAEGDAGGNRTLSTRRAEATRDYLATKGVDAARIAPRGFGEADPVASNDTEDGRARNRRVVFALRQN